MLHNILNNLLNQLIINCIHREYHPTMALYSIGWETLDIK